MSSDFEFVLAPERGPDTDADADADADDRPSPLAGTLPLIVDGFEAGDLSAYRGDTDCTRIATDQVRRGTYSLEATPEPGDTVSLAAHSATRLLARGHAYRCWYRPAERARVEFDFLTAADGTGGYAVVHDRARSQYTVRRRGPDAETLASNSTGHPADSRATGWYQQKVCIAADGSLVATLSAPNDQVLARILAQDSTQIDGYHGFAVTDAPAHIDRLVKVPL